MQRPAPNPILEFVERQGVMVLDGGLATTLEARGHALDDALWSARLLLDAPDAIRSLHRDFLEAGADCITSASYQASLAGFAERGLSEAHGVELLEDSVRLAVEARDAFWGDEAGRGSRLRPLVAASVGPYGAFLADGSEYTGRYGIGDVELRTFHRERWHVLAESRADLLACETIPSGQEAEVLLGLLGETPGRWAWLSFSCRDGAHLSDGSRLSDVARLCDAVPDVAGVGINCTAPELVSPLLGEARRATGKPILVYPNSGERYDVVRRIWLGDSGSTDWAAACAEWSRLGAAAIGGCCRVGPADIGAMRRQLVS
ncbi:MAG: homocysteine S-methyltransferase [Planctomycetota bacterium]